MGRNLAVVHGCECDPDPCSGIMRQAGFSLLRRGLDEELRALEAAWPGVVARQARWLADEVALLKGNRLTAEERKRRACLLARWHERMRVELAARLERVAQKVERYNHLAPAGTASTARVGVAARLAQLDSACAPWRRELRALLRRHAGCRQRRTYSSTVPRP